MINTLRSRLWLGYSILIFLILCSFFIGLFITLNRTSALYRQIEFRLRLEEQTLLTAITQNPGNNITTINASLKDLPATETLRVFLLDDQVKVLFDSKEGNAPAIEWKHPIGLRKRADSENSLLILDVDRKIWIYVIHRLAESDQFLIVAAPRGNLTLKFMLSDPMMRMILSVLFVSIIVSIFLTLLMDQWLAKPIRDFSKATRTMAILDHDDLPLKGPQEIQELANSLNHMNHQLRESQRSQKDFISDVSHELKTPLTSIQGFAGAIMDGMANDDKSIKHAAQVISTESERMLRLVTDLLTLARFEGGVENLHISRVDLCELVSGVVEKISITARQTGVLIQNSIRDLPAINADADRITQVLTNLIDNAVKYSRPGGVVELSYMLDKETVRIHIADHGIGIAAENLSKIFNRFFQVDKARTGGTRRSAGLGLPIALQIAHAHGGDILVKSEPDKGTVFTLVLPLPNIR